MPTQRKEVEKTSRSAPSRRKQDVPIKAVLWGGVVTSLIKLGGLVLAGNEALFQPAPHDAVVFGLAAFMMAGAQGVDSLLGSIFQPRKSEE